MYIKYSTRKFKISHLKRIKLLKDWNLALGTHKSQEEILTEVVEEGLKIVEAVLQPSITFALQEEDRMNQEWLKKRTAPMGIKDE